MGAVKVLTTSFAELQQNAIRDQRKPRFHGNGFVQLYLDDVNRLHVYHPDLVAVRVANARIHDHRWTFHSKVLIGTLGHQTYDIVPTDFGRWSAKEVPGASNKEVPLQEVPNSRCEIYLTGHYDIVAGSSYVFSRRNFHKSHHSGITMTFIEKRCDDGNPARVISPYGEVPDHAFAVQPPEQDLWTAIKDAFALWNKQ